MEFNPEKGQVITKILELSLDNTVRMKVRKNPDSLRNYEETTISPNFSYCDAEITTSYKNHYQIPQQNLREKDLLFAIYFVVIKKVGVEM